MMAQFHVVFLKARRLISQPAHLIYHFVPPVSRRPLGFRHSPVTTAEHWLGYRASSCEVSSPEHQFKACWSIHYFPLSHPHSNPDQLISANHPAKTRNCWYSEVRRNTSVPYAVQVNTASFVRIVYPSVVDKCSSTQPFPPEPVESFNFTVSRTSHDLSPPST